MSYNIYENGQLNKIAGRAVMDAELDANSTNGVQNKVVTEAITQLNNDLTSNNNKYIASYQNSKYGFVINGTFYEIGGGGMPILNWSQPLYTFSDSNTQYTATKDCYLYGTCGVLNPGTCTVMVDGKAVLNLVSGTNYIVPYTKIKQGSVITANAPYTNLNVYEEL